MESKKLLALVAVSGLALAGYASAASSGALPDGLDMGLGVNAKCARGAVTDDAAQEAQVEERVKVCERHGGRMALPAFEEDGATVTGKWVSFTKDADNVSLLDFTSKGPFADAVLFDSVQFATDGAKASVLRGGLWIGHAGDVVATAIDAPNAFLGVLNKGNDSVTVTYTVADGIVLTELPDEASGPDAKGVLLAKDGHAAALRVHRNATYSVDGQVVTVTLPPGGAASFHIRGFPKLLQHELRALHHLGGLAEQCAADQERCDALKERCRADPERCRAMLKERRGGRGPPPNADRGAEADDDKEASVVEA